MKTSLTAKLVAGVILLATSGALLAQGAPDATKPETARDDQATSPETARDDQSTTPESARDDQAMTPETATDEDTTKAHRDAAVKRGAVRSNRPPAREPSDATSDDLDDAADLDDQEYQDEQDDPDPDADQEDWDNQPPD